MNIEQLKKDMKEYQTENNLKYLRKSQLAIIANNYNYEWDDVLDFCNYSNDITRFYEKLDGKRYLRYILTGALSVAAITEATGLNYCSECNSFATDMLEAADGQHFCSETCANYNGYYYCTECGKLEKYAYKGGASLILCKKCLKDNADKYNLKKCDHCHKYFAADSCYEVDGQYFCTYCVDNLNFVNAYHDSSKNFAIHTKNRERKITFGYENEMEVKDGKPRNLVVLGLNNLLEKYNLKSFFKYENDSSLKSGVNIEAITDAFTLPWLYDMEQPLQTIYDYINKSCSGELTKSAGLHVHISRNAFSSDYALAKFAYVIHNLQYDFLKFSKRPLNNLGYSVFDNFQNDDGVYNFEDFKRKYASNTAWSTSYNHYDVINRQHEKTIEFRLFRGTTDLKRIIANIELINNLAYFVENRTDEQIKAATFKEICLFKKTKYLRKFYFETFEPQIKVKEVA